MLSCPYFKYNIVLFNKRINIYMLGSQSFSFKFWKFFRFISRGSLFLTTGVLTFKLKY